MRFLIISSLYRYLSFVAPISKKSAEILRQVSGVEPTLFFAPRLVDWQNKVFHQDVVDKIVNLYQTKNLPLTDQTHGLRLHGLIDLGRPGNRIHYADNVAASVGVLTEQIKLVAQLAKLAKIDTAKHPSIITIHLGRSRGKLNDELDRIVDIFNQVSDLAAQHHVIINMENVWNPGQKIEYSLGSNLSDFVYIFDRLKQPQNFGLTFDFAHALIHYQGDYEKIKSDLQNYNLLEKITYLHLTVPGHHYRHKLNWKIDPRKLPGLGPVVYFFYKNPDGQSGIKYLKNDYPSELQKLSELISFVAKNSILKKDKTFHCATVEMGAKIWGTHSGATISDIAQTFDFFKASLNQ